MTAQNAQQYRALQHAMQSGVAMMMNKEPKETEPKHLRVGVNTALSDHASLARLLISKGIITQDEYEDAILAGMVIEVENYKGRIHNSFGMSPDQTVELR